MSFGTKYSGTYIDTNSSDSITVNLLKRNYSGSSTTLSVVSQVPLTKKYRGGREDSPKSPISASEVQYSYWWEEPEWVFHPLVNSGYTGSLSGWTESGSLINWVYSANTASLSSTASLGLLENSEFTGSLSGWTQEDRFGNTDFAWSHSGNSAYVLIPSGYSSQLLIQDFEFISGQTYHFKIWFSQNLPIDLPPSTSAYPAFSIQIADPFAQTSAVTYTITSTYAGYAECTILCDADKNEFYFYANNGSGTNPQQPISIWVDKVEITNLTDTALAVNTYRIGDLYSNTLSQGFKFYSGETSTVIIDFSCSEPLSTGGTIAYPDVYLTPSVNLISNDFEILSTYVGRYTIQFEADQDYDSISYYIRSNYTGIGTITYFFDTVSITNDTNSFVPFSNWYESGTTATNEIFESNYRDWQLEVIKNGNRDWIGWIDPTTLSKSWLDTQYLVTVSAIDGLKDLDSILFPSSAITSSYQKAIISIKECLKQTGLEIDIDEQSNFRDINQPTGATFNKSYITSKRFQTTKDGRTTYIKCNQALEYMLNSWNLELYQVSGKWRITARNEVASPLTSYNWSVLSSTTVNHSYTRYLDISDYNPLFRTDELSKIKPLSYVDLTMRNRNEGGNLLSNVSGEWNNSTGSDAFETFDNSTDGQVLIGEYEGTGGNPNDYHYFESDPVNITVINTADDQIQFTLRATTSNAQWDTGSPMYMPVITLTLLYPDSATTYTVAGAQLPLVGGTTNFQLIAPLYDGTNMSGNYRVRVGIDVPDDIPVDMIEYDVFFDTFELQALYASDASKDQYYLIQNTGNTSFLDNYEYTTYFGDSYQNTDLGAVKYGTINNNLTSLWTSYGNNEYLNLQYLLGLLHLRLRPKFIDFIRISLIDYYSIQINNIIHAKGRDYRIVGYQYDYFNNVLQIEIQEYPAIEVGASYNNIQLETTDGRSSGSGGGSGSGSGTGTGGVSNTYVTVNEFNSYTAVTTTFNVSIKEQIFTSTGQTIFTVSNGTIQNIAFVEVNGNVQLFSTDYSVSGNVITFVSPVPNASTVCAHYFEILSNVGFEIENFTSSGQTVFETVGTISTILFIDINGNTQLKNVDFSVSGNVITFVSPVPSSSTVQIHYFTL